MRNIFELTRAILGSRCPDDTSARQLLHEADVLGVDILTHIVHSFGLHESEVYERAADYCGLAFSPAFPRDLAGTRDIATVEHLSQVRSLRVRLFDREVMFAAPGAAEMLVMAERPRGVIRDICILPPGPLQAELVRRSQAALLERAWQHLLRRWPHVCTHLEAPHRVRIGFVAVLALMIVATVVAPFWLEPVLLPMLAALFIAPAWFRLWALVEEPSPAPEHGTLLADGDLPVYSVLIPLRDETAMVPQLAAAMKALDYPAAKLDIRFVVESASADTVRAVKQACRDVAHFHPVVVPAAGPATKPKAMNYALPAVRGRYVVVYDAEDIPEPDQLRRAATRFAAEPDMDCLQAELVIDNGRDNWITALFAAEYSALFGLMLPAIARAQLPMPLGGTSNHFRVRALRELGGWDAFNVTEDADLGVRMSRLRYRVGTLDSRTYEEAPNRLAPWIRQRTRWMKGWMQTFIVHNRDVRALLRDQGWRSFFAFEIYVGGMLFSAPLHLAFLLSLTFKLTLAEAVGLTGVERWEFVHIFVLFSGYLGATAHALAGAARLRQPGIMLAQALLPLYWAMSGLAAVRAAHELITRPYFWAKTAHGQTHGRSRRIPDAGPGRSATAPHRQGAGFEYQP